MSIIRSRPVLGSLPIPNENDTTRRSDLTKIDASSISGFNVAVASASGDDGFHRCLKSSSFEADPELSQ